MMKEKEYGYLKSKINNIGGCMRNIISEQALSQYDFPVTRELLNCDDKTFTGRHVIRRKDNGIVLGVVGEDYELLTHKNAVSGAEKTLNKLGKWELQKFFTANDGARLYAQYNFPEKKYTVGNLLDGRPDDVCISLTMTNSYDGLLKFGFILGAYRFICANGLKIGHDIFSIRRRHTSGLDPDAIFEKANESFSYFETKTYPKYLELSKIEVESPKLYLEHMKEDKVLPVRLIDKVAEKAVEKATNEWGIYNEFTRFLSHDYNKSNVRKEELNQVVAKAFGL